MQGAAVNLLQPMSKCADPGSRRSIRCFVQASTNGIFINNFRVLEKGLQNGDVVQFGGAAGVPVGTEFAGNCCQVRCVQR